MNFLLLLVINALLFLLLLLHLWTPHLLIHSSFHPFHPSSINTPSCLPSFHLQLTHLVAQFGEFVLQLLFLPSPINILHHHTDKGTQHALNSFDKGTLKYPWQRTIACDTFQAGKTPIFFFQFSIFFIFNIPSLPWIRERVSDYRTWAFFSLAIFSAFFCCDCSFCCPRAISSVIDWLEGGRSNWIP